MFQVIRNMLFHTTHKRLNEVMYDIDLFYSYLEKNNANVDEWYFRNVFTLNYCYFLKNFSYLKNEEQNYLHRGVLTLMLFKSFSKIQSGNYFQAKENYKNTEVKLVKFSTTDPLTEKLRKLTLGATKLLKKTKNKKIDSNENKELIRSVTWALHNIVLINEPSKVKSIER